MSFYCHPFSINLKYKTKVKTILIPDILPDLYSVKHNLHWMFYIPSLLASIYTFIFSLQTSSGVHAANFLQPEVVVSCTIPSTIFIHDKTLKKFWSVSLFVISQPSLLHINFTFSRTEWGREQPWVEKVVACGCTLFFQRQTISDHRNQRSYLARNL